jgi:hypothetical protein
MSKATSTEHDHAATRRQHRPVTWKPGPFAVFALVMLARVADAISPDAPEELQVPVDRIAGIRL